MCFILFFNIIVVFEIKLICVGGLLEAWYRWDRIIGISSYLKLGVYVLKGMKKVSLGNVRIKENMFDNYILFFGYIRYFLRV